MDFEQTVIEWGCVSKLQKIANEAGEAGRDHVNPPIMTQIVLQWIVNRGMYQILKKLQTKPARPAATM